MIITKSSHPNDQDLNIRVTMNDPENGVIERGVPPVMPTDYLVGAGRQMIVFSGSDRRSLSDLAADAFLATTMPRVAMSTAFGKVPFLKRLEERVASGGVLAAVPGNQINDEGRIRLFRQLLQNDPHIHVNVFEDLMTSDYLLVARHAFLLNYGVIATMVTDDVAKTFDKLSKIPLLSDMEKKETGWTVADRIKLIKLFHEGVDESERFQQWFVDNRIEEVAKIRSVAAVSKTSKTEGNA